MQLVCETISAQHMLDACRVLRQRVSKKDQAGVSNAADILVTAFESAVNHLEDLLLEPSVG